MMGFCESEIDPEAYWCSGLVRIRSGVSVSTVVGERLQVLSYSRDVGRLVLILHNLLQEAGGLEGVAYPI